MKIIVKVEVYEECEKCEATGLIKINGTINECNKCKGHGEVELTKKIEIIELKQK